MTIRMNYIPAVAAALGLAVAGCGGDGKDKVKEAIDVLTSSEPSQAEVDRALSISDALAPPAPGGTPLPEITLAVDRAADGGVGITVTRGPAGPEFEAGDSETFDDAWTRAGAQASVTGSVERVTVYTDIQVPGVAVGGTGEVPDEDYLYLGWWLSEPDDLEGEYEFRAFADGTEPFTPGDKFTANQPGVLERKAEYRGLAAGRYATKDFRDGALSSAAAGAFTATTELTANFGGTSVAEDDHFSISGRVTAFMDADDGDPLGDWTVTLERIDLVAGSASFGGGATAAELGQSTGEGSWEGAFFGNGRADGQPGSVAGTFDAHLPAARISGGFGASNTVPDE